MLEMLYRLVSLGFWALKKARGWLSLKWSKVSSEEISEISLYNAAYIHCIVKYNKEEKNRYIVQTII